MQVGLNLPVMVPGLERAALEQWCRRIDTGPFSCLAVGERINYPNPEITVTLSLAAAWTSRVRLLYNVIVLPMHPELLAAKQIATLDRLSGGRVCVGLGVGGRADDYAALGAAWDAKRLRRLETQVERMRRAWAGERLVPSAHRPIGPPPTRPSGPELLAGSIFPDGIRRAARWADGLIGFSFGMTSDELVYAFAAARTAWRDAGRATAPRLVTGCFFALGATPETQMDRCLTDYLDFMGAGAAGLRQMVTTCGAAGLRDALTRARDAGADEIVLTPSTTDPDEVGRLADVIGALALDPPTASTP